MITMGDTHRKIIVIGSPGAGKSTFSRKLRDLNGLPLFYLDMIWHKPDKTNVSQEEFDRRLIEILQKDEWIIDGNYLRCMPLRLEYCDLIYFFDLPMEECLAGALDRIGTKREDMPWVEEEADEEFMEYIRNFPNIQLPKIYELIDHSDKELIIFKSREDADEYLRNYENR